MFVMYVISQEKSIDMTFKHFSIFNWKDKTVADTLQDKSIRNYVKSFIGYLFLVLVIRFLYMCHY